jgi:uncharacterized protein YbjT (DUF2867 family)
MTPIRTALVLGASGDQGFPQIAKLVAAGVNVRAVARDAAKLQQRIDAALGASAATPATGAATAGDATSPAARATAHRADYADVESLARALDGVDVVLANYPSSSIHDGDSLVAAAALVGELAARAGVRSIVFNTSLPLPDRPLGMRAQDVRFAQRDAMAARGVPVITLAPVVYMDNLLRGWAYPEIVERNRFEYPHGHTLEVSWLCQDDLGSLMAAATVRPHLAGRTFAIGGPEVLRGPDVARFLSEASGRTIEFVSQPIEAFCARMRRVFERSSTLDADSMVRELERVYHWYNEAPEKPFRVDMTPVLRELPVRLTTFREWAGRQEWGARRG